MYCAVFQDETITKHQSFTRLFRGANKTGSYTAILFLYPAFEHRKKGLIVEISTNIEVLDSRLRIIVYHRFVFKLECGVTARTSATKTFLTTA